jgi:hypothetical protein
MRQTYRALDKRAFYLINTSVKDDVMRNIKLRKSTREEGAFFARSESRKNTLTEAKWPFDEHGNASDL